MDENIKVLSKYEHFARFIKDVKDRRESSISRLRSASPEEVMQISGEILAYDDILQDSDSENLLKKWSKYV